MITDRRINEDHWDLLCSSCKKVCGFQVVRREVFGARTNTYSGYSQDWNAPHLYTFRCPICKAFKQWIIFEIHTPTQTGQHVSHYFRVTSIPSEGLEDIEELPDTPSSLRTAFVQAIRAMDANAHLAAAAMFRRALQVITRDLLKTERGNLAWELNQCVGRTYNGATITSNFATVGYIIKEAGNQGAHPDADPDLLDFTAQDASDLQDIFMELVSELFIIPAAKEKAKTEFLARKKITPKTSPP